MTFNTADFPDEALRDHDLLLTSVDDAIVLISSWYGDMVRDVVRAQLAPLTRPRLTEEEFVDRLAHRAPFGAVVVGKALGISGYLQTHQDILDAGQETSPQIAVSNMIEALREGRDVEACSYVHAPLAARLTGRETPDPQTLSTALRRQLGDVFSDGGWGFGTSKRFEAPAGPVSA